MTTQIAPLPYQGKMAGFRRFSVAEYHRLIQCGILTEDDNLELLEGYLVHKMTRNPPHDSALMMGIEVWPHVLPSGWGLRQQSAITLPDSEPEPDFAIVRGKATSYRSSHPTPTDIACVIEVSESTLPGDRDDKARIYARAGIVCYWIINLVDRQIEVYTAPSGPAAVPAYGQRVDYRVGNIVALSIGGTTVQVAVQDLLP